MQVEQQLFPSLQMFGEDASSAGAEPAEGALQIALARLMPVLLKAQVKPPSRLCNSLMSMYAQHVSMQGGVS